MDLELLEFDADDHAVVEEALALIDALEAADSPSSPSSSSSSPSVNLHPKSRSSLKKRRRSAAVDAARRQRKKQERIALQSEANELEGILQLLRGGASTALISKLSEAEAKSGEWYSNAIDQVRRLADATDLNWRLRSALSRQSELLNAVRIALSQPQPIQDGPERIILTSEDYNIMRSLKLSIQQLYEGLDDALEPVAFTSGLFSSNLAFKMDPVFGPYSEHTSATLVPHRLDKVVELVEELQVCPPCVALRFHITSSATGAYHGTEKQYAMELHTPSKSIPLRGLGAIRLHRESHRAAVVWSKQVVHATGLRFHERSWLLAISSPTNPETQTIVRTYTQLTVEKPAIVSQEDDLCGLIRSNLATRTRDKLEMIQFKLLEK